MIMIITVDTLGTVNYVVEAASMAYQNLLDPTWEVKLIVYIWLS